MRSRRRSSVTDGHETWAPPWHAARYSSSRARTHTRRTRDGSRGSRQVARAGGPSRACTGANCPMTTRLRPSATSWISCTAKEPRLQRFDGEGEPDFEQTLFSNVNAAIPRAIWEQYPFADDLIMSEDQEWSRRVIRAGHELVYEPDAVVRHSHHYSVAAAFRRFFDSGVSAERSYASNGGGGRALRRAGARYARGEVEWLWRRGSGAGSPMRRCTSSQSSPACKLGRRHKRLPSSIRRHLSALPAYWD